MSTAAEVRELRADIRHWRRSRADTRLIDVLQDAYIAVFAVTMFGAMLTNVVINVARLSGDACAAQACRSGRTALPWLVALGTLALAAALGRLFGPVFVTPAMASWLLPAPLHRAALIRPRLLTVLLAGGVAALLPGAVASTLAGFGLGPVIAFTVTMGLLAVAVLAVLVLVQRRATAAGTLSRAPGLLLWVGLVLLALGMTPALTPPHRLRAAWWAVPIASLLAAAGATAVAIRELPRLRDRDVTAGSHLAPGLSGALATLDLALLYDVVVGHRWGRRASVAVRRGAARGPAAVVWTDLVRLRRNPGAVVVLLSGLALPYAVAATGGGRVTLLVAAAVGFLAGLPLLVALRVLTRTPSLLRMLPFPVAQTRRLAVRVPSALQGAFGVLAAPALHEAVGGTAADAVLLGIAVGACGLAAGVRWVTGRPPDYSRPLVSSPAGAVPTNLYGSALRGFDVLVLTTAPLLALPDARGVALSLLLSGAVLAHLTGRA